MKHLFILKLVENICLIDLNLKKLYFKAVAWLALIRLFTLVPITSTKIKTAILAKNGLQSRK